MLTLLNKCFSEQNKGPDALENIRNYDLQHLVRLMKCSGAWQGELLAGLVGFVRQLRPPPAMTGSLGG